MKGITTSTKSTLTNYKWIVMSIEIGQSFILLSATAKNRETCDIIILSSSNYLVQVNDKVAFSKYATLICHFILNFDKIL